MSSVIAPRSYIMKVRNDCYYPPLARDLICTLYRSSFRLTKKIGRSGLRTSKIMTRDSPSVKTGTWSQCLLWLGHNVAGGSAVVDCNTSCKRAQFSGKGKQFTILPWARLSFANVVISGNDFPLSSGTHSLTHHSRND